MVLWGLGAGSLSAFRLGRRLQSSIRSRGADQSVVRCSGAQSIPRPFLIDAEKEARHRSELARACTSRPRERESGVSWRWSCGLGQLLVVVVVVGGLVFEAADLAVAEPVVAEGEDLAGDGDLGDVAPAALGDPLERRRAAARRRWGSSGRPRSAPSAAPGSLGGRCAPAGPCRRSCARSAPARPRRTECRAVGKRLTSPTSAMISIAV